MNRFFYWLADKLRPWHGSWLPEELELPYIPLESFLQGEMARTARLGVGLTSGIFGIIGADYARRAAKAWRPREIYLMEEISLALHLVEEQRQRGILVESIDIDRFVETLFLYFAYLGESRTKNDVRKMVNDYLDEHSAPDADTAAGFSRIKVDHPLLDALRLVDEEMCRKFQRQDVPALFDLGLRLDRELDASRYPSCTPNNCRSFASTGGDGVHFSLLIQDHAITEASPVVMTVPLPGDSVIVGETLFDFLCLGVRWGYFMLEGLIHDPDETLRMYTSPDWQPPKDWEGPSSFNLELLDFLARRLDLKPWSSGERFQELQDRYGPLLKYPPQ